MIVLDSPFHLLGSTFSVSLYSLVYLGTSFSYRKLQINPLYLGVVSASSHRPLASTPTNIKIPELICKLPIRSIVT